MLLSRYKSLDYILSLEPAEANELIVTAYTKRQEELLFSRWIAGYQYEISFDEFKRALEPVELKDEEEIIANAEAIMAKFLEERDLHGDF